MPTYGYECLGCHAQFEIMQSIKDAPLTTCETCGGPLRKRIYPVGIAFKGSGFYVNDYAPKTAIRLRLPRLIPPLSLLLPMPSPAKQNPSPQRPKLLKRMHRKQTRLKPRPLFRHFLVHQAKRPCTQRMQGRFVMPITCW